MNGSTKHVAIAAIALVAIVAICGIAMVINNDSPDDSGSDDPYLVFTDSVGTEHVLDEPLERVIILNRQTAEAFTILGAESIVVATGDTTTTNNSYLGYNDLPDLGELSSLNYEAIIDMQPDAIFTKTNDAMDLERMVGGAGIEIIRIDNYAPETFDEEMILLGKILGKENRAQEFLDYKNEIESIVAERIATLNDDERPSVMALSVGALNGGTYRVFPVYSTDGSAGVGEGYSTIMAGGKDSTPEVKYENTAGTAVLIDEEYFLECNPDVITLHGTWLGGYNCDTDDVYQETMENIYNITSISQTTAGSEKKVYIFHTDFLGASKRHIGLLQLAQYLHPDLFSDISVDEYAQEYFENWLGVEYKGIWFYAAK